VNEREMMLATLAARKVEEAGGAVTFEQFDGLMAPEGYFAPASWASGWGLPRAQRKANTDKLCAFAACKAGLLRQTDTGYEVTAATKGGE
jgi:hypothetical protein